ncbi:MAG: VPLPA-CTERM sorting domain-containing protein [Pseudomonadota bacterium]
MIFRTILIAAFASAASITDTAEAATRTIQLELSDLELTSDDDLFERERIPTAQTAVAQFTFDTTVDPNTVPVPEDILTRTTFPLISYSVQLGDVTLEASGGGLFQIETQLGTFLRIRGTDIPFFLDFELRGTATDLSDSSRDFFNIEDPGDDASGVTAEAFQGFADTAETIGGLSFTIRTSALVDSRNPASIRYNEVVVTDITDTVAVVPLPATVPLLLVGIGALAVFRKRSSQSR